MFTEANIKVVVISFGSVKVCQYVAFWKMSDTIGITSLNLECLRNISTNSHSHILFFHYLIIGGRRLAFSNKLLFGYVFRHEQKFVSSSRFSQVMHSFKRNVSRPLLQ